MAQEPEQQKPLEADSPPTPEKTEPASPNPSEAKVDQTADANKGDDSPATIEKIGDESDSSQPAVSGEQISTERGNQPVSAAETQQPSEPESLDEEADSKDPGPTVDQLNDAVLAKSRRHTRRSFIVAAAAAAAGYNLYNWIDHLPAKEMQPEGYRKAFKTNAAISRTIFDERDLSPTYPLSKAENLRVNGVYGLKMMLEPGSYRLQLVGSTASASHPRYAHDVTAWDYVYIDAKTMESQGHDTKTPPPSARTSEKMPPASMVKQEEEKENRSGRMARGKEEAGESRSTLLKGTPGLLLLMEDILKLPRYELVTQFKCIEGWSQVVHWAGVRMVDFLEAYPPALINGAEPKYVYMETPDGDYYTGYDLHVCRHPQTLLVTEMMGAPLTQYHGAPLRLHMPTKYGYKQIKRIGLISYTNSKPDDYWTKLGYDWYAGL